MSKKVSTSLLLIITAIGTALRSYHLTARSLWFDEAFSWRLVQFNWSEMITRAAADVHPPLYYLLLKSWSLVFASSLLSLRSFSVLFAATTILAGYLFASSVFRSRLTGLTAAAFIALSGFQIQYGWEARMYTLGTTLALSSSWLLILGIRKPRLYIWLLYSVTAVAFAYTHYFAFFSLAAHAIFVITYLIYSARGRPGEVLQNKILWYALISAIVALVIYLPWLPTFLSQNRQVQEAYWVPELSLRSIPSTWYRFISPTNNINTHQYRIWVITVSSIFLISLIGRIIIPSWRRKLSKTVADGSYFVLLMILTPFVLAVILSLIGQSLYNDRFFVFAQLFALVALASLISHISFKWIRYSFITLTLIALGGASVTYYLELNIENKPGAHAATTTIYPEISPREAVIVSSPFVYFAIDHYATEEFDIYKPLQEKPLSAPRLYSESGELSHFSGGPILTNADIIGPDIFERRDLSAIWIVDTSGFGSTALQPPSPWRAETTSTFPEVFDYQGEVSITRYIR